MVSGCAHRVRPAGRRTVTFASGAAPALTGDPALAVAAGAGSLTTGRSRPLALTAESSSLTLAERVCSSISLGRFQLVVAVDQRNPLSFNVLCKAAAVLLTPTTTVASVVWWIRGQLGSVRLAEGLSM